MAALMGAGNLTTVGATSSTTSLTIPVPANVAVGHLLIVGVMFQNSNNTATVTPPSGAWVPLSLGSPGNGTLRAMRAFGLPVPDQAAKDALAGSYTFTTDVTLGRAVGMMFIDDDVDLAVIANGYSSWSAQSTNPTYSAYTITAAEATTYLLSYTNTSAGTAPPSGTVSGMTLVGQAVSSIGAGTPPASSTISMFTAAAATLSQPSRVIAYTPAPTNAAGYQFAVRRKPTAFATDVALSGSGELLADETPSRGATAALSGAGALSVGTSQHIVITGPLAGAGALALEAYQGRATTLALAGSGQSTHDAVPGYEADVLLAGGGSLQVAIAEWREALFIGHATGTLSAPVRPGLRAAAALGGTGTLIPLAVVPGRDITVTARLADRTQRLVALPENRWEAHL